MKKNTIIIFVLLVSLAVAVYAQDVSNNGTPHPHGITSSGLGTTIGAEGGTFDITGGTQKGSNLFHSFGKFNIHSGESAVFHDAGITNTIGRVTGGEYSWINGRITSGAENLYLLNPAGVMFGANASLDLQGSFHISTADYLRLGENEKFFAEPMEGEVLSVAAPSAFGFLDKSVGKISLDGSFLNVAEKETLSFIGDDISIKNSTLYSIEGNVSITSVASSGELIFIEDDLDVSSFEKMGNITISDDSRIETSGQGSGNIFIRGEKFVAENSLIDANTLEDIDGGIIDIQVGNFSFTNGASILSVTDGTGKGADIRIYSADSIIFAGEDKYGWSIVNTSTSYEGEGGGDAGNLFLEADNITFKDGATITSNTYGTGDSGKVTLNADDTVSFSGTGKDGKGGGIGLVTLYESEGGGKGGELLINASNISFSDGAYIDAFTFGKGDGGEVNLEAGETIRFAGEDKNQQSSIIAMATLSENEDAGNGGNLHLKGNNISFQDGASINISTFGTGDAGNAEIKAAETVLFEGENSQTRNSGIRLVTSYTDETAGDGGSLRIDADNILFKEGAYLDAGTLGQGEGGEIYLKASDTVRFTGENSKGLPSRILVSTSYNDKGAGDGGELLIEGNHISLEDGGFIMGSTIGKGTAGSIKLHADEQILFTGRTSLGYSSYLISSVHYYSNGGDGGEIWIESEKIVLTDGAGINTSTSGTGDAGKIYIETSQLELNDDASIDSSNSIASTLSSPQGDAGTITIAREIQKNDNGKIIIITEPAESVRLNGNGVSITTSTEGQGDAGDINIGVKSLTLENGARIASESTGNSATGNAGIITIAGKIRYEKAEDSESTTQTEIEILAPADSVTLRNSSVTTDAENAGGGKISIDAGNSLYLRESEITTSVMEQGDAGDITIGNNDNRTGPELTILNHSKIKANAEGEEGYGGAVFIYTDNYLKSSDSSVTASSKTRGNEGEVRIEAPDTDISGSMIILTGGMIDASKWLPVTCSHRTGEDVSRFFMTGFDAMPDALDGPLASPPVPFGKSDSDDDESGKSESAD